MKGVYLLRCWVSNGVAILWLTLPEGYTPESLTMLRKGSPIEFAQVASLMAVCHRTFHSYN